jgi:hypothetical protein
LKKVFVLAVLAIFSACSTVKREAGYPGGNLGHYTNEKLYQAYDHRQRVERNILLLAVLAPLAAETARSEQDAELSIASINVVYQGLNDLTSLLQTCGQEGMTGSRHWRSSHYIDEKQDDPVLATLPPAAPPQDLDTGTYGGEEDVEGAQNGVLVWSDDYFNFRFEGVFKLVPDQQDSKYTLYKGQVLVQKKQEPLDEPCDASAVAQGSLYEFETKDLVVQKALFRLLRTSADNLGIKLERPRASQVSLKTIWGLLRASRKMLAIMVDYLASFRDVTVIYASAVHANCENAEVEKGYCKELGKYFAPDGGFLHRRKAEIKMGVDVGDLYRPLYDMMQLATKVAEQQLPQWRIPQREMAALLKHVELACDSLAREAGHDKDGDDDFADGCKKASNAQSEQNRAQNAYDALLANAVVQPSRVDEQAH